MKYLDPKADLTFKKVFGGHPDLVISFLNALLPISEEDAITEIEYLPSDLVPDNPWRKYSIVDVRCKDKKERQFLVEMQMEWSPEFEKRVLFNASKAYVKQLEAGENYELLQPVYSLNLVNSIIEPKLEGFYHHYAMIHVEHSDKVIEGLQLIFVELPKFNPETYSGKKMQILWLRFLTEIGEKTREAPEELTSDPLIQKALTQLQESAFTDVELAGYEKFWDSVSIARTLHSSWVREGRREGMKEGIAKGKAEVALSLKQKGMDIASIADATGLPIDFIAAL